MEELGGVDALGADPVLLLPVAHGVGVGGAVLVASAHEVVEPVIVVLLGELQAEGIGGLLHFHQIPGQMGIHLGVVLVVLRELPPVVHKPVGHHEEFQLLIGGVSDLPVHHSSQLGGLHVDKAQHPGAGGLGFLHAPHHLLGAAGDGGDHYNGPIPHPPAAGGQVLRRVLHKEIQVGALLHVDLGLEAGGPGAPDAQPA